MHSVFSINNYKLVLCSANPFFRHPWFQGGKLWNLVGIMNAGRVNLNYVVIEPIVVIKEDSGAVQI
eukprot:snap_masked-scaffold_17-processed-gene-4.24-mRNA-1 protein AED:1.00 eAED:1.00 QI:0/-1/0/0/-1/1/1/0/65